MTGAAGFVGHHCIDPLLKLGYHVHGVSRTSRSDTEGVTWHTGDLLTDDATALLNSIRPTHMLHLAWYTEHTSFYTSPENHRWVDASVRLLEAFCATGGKRAVMTGSCAEYDWRHGHCTETNVASLPETLYGECKLRLFNELQRISLERGVPAAWARLFFTFGPGENRARLVPAVICALLQGERAKCSHGRQVRDYLYVGDVADALVSVLDSEAKGAINIGSGIGTEIRTLAQRFADALQRPDGIDFGAIPTRAGDAPVVVADVTRLRDEVGWRPSADADAAVRETIEYWKDHLDTKGER